MYKALYKPIGFTLLHHKPHSQSARHLNSIHFHNYSSGHIIITTHDKSFINEFNFNQ